jgi:hypothetical protein
MLTFILIGGLVWFVVALVLVLALAAAARKQVSPVPTAAESTIEETSPASSVRATSSAQNHPVQVEHPLAT